MLTEHLTGQRQLPATEQELHTQLEKRALKDLRKQQAAAEAAANKAAERAEMETTLHTDALQQQIAEKARSEARATGATEKEAQAAGETTLAMARAERHAPHAYIRETDEMQTEGSKKPKDNTMHINKGGLARRQKLGWRQSRIATSQGAGGQHNDSTPQ